MSSLNPTSDEGFLITFRPHQIGGRLQVLRTNTQNDRIKSKDSNLQSAHYNKDSNTKVGQKTTRPRTTNSRAT